MKAQNNENIYPNIWGEHFEGNTGIVTWKVGETTRWKVEKVLKQWSEGEKIVMNQSTIDNIRWDRWKIASYLYHNCMHTEEWVEKCWEKGTYYYLTLPAINWFKCKKLSRFVSYRSITKEEYDKNMEWQRESSKIEDISAKILEPMRDFMNELWVIQDRDVDFVKEMFENESCYTWETVKDATGLDVFYRTSSEKEDYRAKWYCFMDYCKFNRFKVSFDTAFLFLWLSVSEIE